MRLKIIRSALLVTAVLVLAFFSERPLPVLDAEADDYFARTTAQAALAYGTVRGVNAVVSVLKESEIELSPAGVGLNLAAGQVLDPIDDLTERLSSVLVTALVSLGLQKLLLEIGALVPLKAAAAVAALLLLPLWLWPRSHPLNQLLLKSCLVLMILRTLLPLSSLASDALYRHLLQQDIVEAENRLAWFAAGQQELSTLSATDNDGLLSALSKDAKARILRARNLYDRISGSVDEIIQALLQLTVLYVSLFILQVLVIPLVSLWLMLFLVKRLFEFRYPDPPTSRLTASAPANGDQGVDKSSA